MRKYILFALFIILAVPFYVFSQPFGSPFGPVPPSNLPYDATTWDGSYLAPTQNAVRDQVELIISGGAFTGYIDFPEIAAPAAPLVNKLRVYAVEDADFTVLETKTDLGVVNRINQDTFRIARNTSGGALAKGIVVRFSGSTGNKPNFAAAQANAIGTMPAVGVLGTAVGSNNYGEVMIVGRLTGIKTNYTNGANPTYAPVADWTEGDVLYVNSSVLGALQNSKPVHPNFAQWIATIETVHATQGSLLVKMQAMFGLEDGTNSNTFTIGDTAAGTKSLKFDGTADAQIDWTGTVFDFSASLLPSAPNSYDIGDVTDYFRYGYFSNLYSTIFTGGVAGSVSGSLVLHDAVTITFHDDGNNTSVIAGPVIDGTTILPFGGAIRASTGILFGTDTAAANTLDDYEEGTWTPSYSTSGTAIDSITYSAMRHGYYTKVGRVVYVTARFRTDSVTLGSASGNLLISGLPFAEGGLSYSQSRLGVFSTVFAGENPNQAIVITSATTMTLQYQTASDGDPASSAPADLTVGASAGANEITLTGWYIAS